MKSGSTKCQFVIFFAKKYIGTRFDKCRALGVVFGLHAKIRA